VVDLRRSADCPACMAVFTHTHFPLNRQLKQVANRTTHHRRDRERKAQVYGARGPGAERWSQGQVHAAKSPELRTAFSWLDRVAFNACSAVKKTPVRIGYL